MGCKHSKDATLVHRTSSVAMPLRPSTPSFYAQNTKLWAPTSGSQTNESREELPSFVVSDSADLVGSSDGEPVHGMMSAFTFSFIQASETSSTHSSLGDSLFTSVEQTTPRPPESLTFAMTGDPIELTAIPEERRGLRDSVEASTCTTQQEIAVLTSSDSGVMKLGEKKSPPPTSATLDGGSSAVSESAVTKSSELAIHELNASGSSRRRSEECSHNTINTRRSVTLSELREGSEYMVTETGAVVRDVIPIEPVSETSPDESGNDFIECQSIEEVATAIAQEVIDAVVFNTTEALVNQNRRQPRGSRSFAASSSLQVEPSSTSLAHSNMKTQQSENTQLLRFCAPIYAIVDTSTDNGVVMYHMQLIDEVTDSTKWPTSLLCRYSGFSEMYSKLKEIKVPAIEKLPKLPRAGVVHFVRGRKSKKTIEERQEQFSNVLRYIAEHRGLHDSAVFQSFLAK